MAYTLGTRQGCFAVAHGCFPVAQGCFPVAGRVSHIPGTPVGGPERPQMPLWPVVRILTGFDGFQSY